MDTLHGHAVPKGFTKVAIQKITTGIKPWPALKDDSEDLSGGSISRVCLPGVGRSVTCASICLSSSLI